MSSMIKINAKNAVNLWRDAMNVLTKIYAHSANLSTSSTRIINAVNALILWRDALCAQAEVPVRSVKRSISSIIISAINAMNS